MYKSDFCEVHYKEQYNVVFVKWKKYCCFNDYREPLMFALEIIRSHKGCNYCADIRNGFEDHPDDTKWVAEYFMPEAVKAGCKLIWFIIDKNNSLKDELEGQAEDSKDIIEFKYIYDISEINNEQPTSEKKNSTPQTSAGYS